MSSPGVTTTLEQTFGAGKSSVETREMKKKPLKTGGRCFFFEGGRFVFLGVDFG